MLKRNNVVGRTVTVSLIAAVPFIFAIATAGPSNGLPAAGSPAVADVNGVVAAMPTANPVSSVDLAAQVTRAVTSALGDAFAGAHDTLKQGCSQMSGFLDETQTQLTDALGNAEQRFGGAFPGAGMARLVK